MITDLISDRYRRYKAGTNKFLTWLKTTASQSRSFSSEDTPGSMVTTADITKLLRRLQGVRRLVFLRNNALVKGSFKTWFNRLVGLIMKVDHHERYDKTPPNLEAVWWEWSYDSTAHRICLEARAPRPIMDEEAYMKMIQPLMEELRISIESEEWNPDPRSRLPFY